MSGIRQRLGRARVAAAWAWRRRKAAKMAGDGRVARVGQAEFDHAAAPLLRVVVAGARGEKTIDHQLPHLVALQLTERRRRSAASRRPAA